MSSLASTHCAGVPLCRDRGGSGRKGNTPQECCGDRRLLTLQVGLAGNALACPRLRLLPALHCDAITPMAQGATTAGIGVTLGDAACEASVRERGVGAEGKVAAFIAGGGAGSRAVCSQRMTRRSRQPRANCHDVQCSLHCACARASQPSPLCSCRLGCTPARLQPLDRAICTATRA